MSEGTADTKWVKARIQAQECAGSANVAYWQHNDDNDFHGQAAHQSFRELAEILGYDVSKRGVASSTNWQAIDSAPDDGERLLLFVPPYGPTTGHFDSGWQLHSVLNKDATPTHWMSLPKPPTPKLEAAE